MKLSTKLLFKLILMRHFSFLDKIIHVQYYEIFIIRRFFIKQLCLNYTLQYINLRTTAQVNENTTLSIALTYYYTAANKNNIFQYLIILIASKINSIKKLLILTFYIIHLKKYLRYLVKEIVIKRISQRNKNFLWRRTRELLDILTWYRSIIC